MTVRGDRVRTLIAKARNGEFPMGVGFVIPHPVAAEIISTFPFEWYIVDQEHTQLSDLTCVAAMGRALEPSGKPWIVKLNTPDPLLARDALDLGAYGLLVPFAHNAAQLREFMDAVRYPPHGTRGFCSLSRALNYGVSKFAKKPEVHDEHIEFVNHEMLVIPTIESLEAVEKLDELLAMPEFDCWHVGVEDLMVAGAHEGYDARWGINLSRTISRRIREAGKLSVFAGLPHTPRADAVARFEGFYIDIPYTSDSLMLGYGCAEMVEISAEAAATLGKGDRNEDVG